MTVKRRKVKSGRVPSLTPLMDVIDEEKRQLLPDAERLRNTRASSLDLYFLGVAEKHGIDLLEADDPLLDEGDEGE